jgi:hypothetical protein
MRLEKDEREGLRQEVNPSTPRPEGLGLPFDKLKAPSKAAGLRVNPERLFIVPS